MSENLNLLVNVAKEKMALELPMVEVFETVEGEGMRAGFPTTFVRVFHCNLRCTWCDTKYSYAPYQPEYYATIEELAAAVSSFGNRHVCLTGGEPLMHREKSLALVEALAAVPCVDDLHIETNGAIDLQPFVELRKSHPRFSETVRFIMDYKLPGSGEQHKMVHENFRLLLPQDEIKFVIASEEDFHFARGIVDQFHHQGQVLFSPVWESMPPKKLVELILQHKLVHVKLNMQVHKIIWDPSQRGV